MRQAVSSVLLAVAFGLAACGQSGTIVSTPGGTVTTSADGSTTTVTGPNGETAQFGAGAASAAQLPDFLPLYPGAKVLSSINAPQAGMQGGSVVFETNASPAEVVAFYKQRATAQGLNEALSSTDGSDMTYMAGKDQTMMQVIASKGTVATEIVLSWTAPRTN